MSLGLEVIRRVDSCFEMCRIIKEGMSELREKLTRPTGPPTRLRVMN